MSIPNDAIRLIILPLRLIFWGGLICVFDFKINGFDLLNDFLGMILITWGVFQVGNVNIHDRYSKAMLFVKLVAVLQCLVALDDHFNYDFSPLVAVILSLFGIAAMLATVVFCIAMRWLSVEAKLTVSDQSWKTTTMLFTIIYLIPLGFFYSAGALATINRESFNLDLGPIGLLLLPIFFIPLIHLFVSTSRMRNESELRVESDQ